MDPFRPSWRYPAAARRFAATWSGSAPNPVRHSGAPGGGLSLGMALRFLPGLVTLAAATAVGAACAAAAAPARNLPAAGDGRQGMLNEAGLGALTGEAAQPLAEVRLRCLRLPAIPQGYSLLDDPRPGDGPPRCAVLEVRPPPQAPRGWIFARYGWTAQTPAGGPGGESADLGRREAEEVVLFEPAGAGRVRPVWHDRFATHGDEVVWRSVTPEAAYAGKGGVLVSVMYCVNGTGGCSQEFLRRGADGRWTAIRQAWLDQLPPGFHGRIRHGVRIEPASLRGEAGFYADGDANCCASQILSVRLALRGDALVLLGQSVAATPAP